MKNRYGLYVIIDDSYCYESDCSFEMVYLIGVYFVIDFILSWLVAVRELLAHCAVQLVHHAEIQHQHV